MAPKRPKGESITAEELVRKLNEDPDYQRRVAWQERRRKRLVSETRRDAGPVLSELADKGIAVESLNDLLNRPINYESAIPVLLKWLPKISNPRVKEIIVRALAVDWARPAAAPLLVHEFRATQEEADHSLRWAIANSLSVVADDSVLEDIIALARDTRFGSSREMLALALGNMKDERATNVLIELLDDPDMAGHAVMALGNRRSVKAQSAIRPLLHHPRGWIRKEARKAMAKLERTTS